MKKNAINFSVLLFGSILGSVLMFGSQILLARNFTVEDYGDFVTVSNLVNIIAVVIGFGVGDFLVKIFSEEGSKAYRWISASKKIFIFNLIFCFVLIFSIYYSDIYSESTNMLLLFFIPNIFLQGLLTITNAANQVEQNFLRVSIFNLLIYVVRFLSILFAVVTTKDVVAIGISMLTLSILMLFPFLKDIRKFFNKSLLLKNNEPISKFVNTDIKTSWKQIYPFGLMGIFYYIYYQSDILFVSFFRGSEASAYYSAAFTIISLTFLIPNVLFRKLYLTKIHIWATHDVWKLLKFYRKANYLMFLLGITGTTVIFFMSSYMIDFIYGNNYVESILYLKLLSFCIVLRFLSSISGTILATKNKMFLKIKIQGLIALLNISLNIIFIPLYGVLGAIVSTIFCEGVLYFLFLLTTRNYLKELKRGEK